MKWFLMNLNMDGAAGGGTGDAAPTVSTPAPTQAAPTQGTPLVGQNPLLDPNWQPAGAPAQAAPQIEELDFAGRKVPVTDPVIKDIHKDYSHLQKTFQETNQTVKSLQEQNQVYMQMIQQFQAQQAQAPAEAQQPQGPTPEELEQFQREYMDTFYENPIEANRMLLQNPVIKDVLNQQIQEAVNQVLGPIQQEKKFNDEVQSMSQKYSDFNQYVDTMQNVLAQNPKLADLGLETVYMVAKGQTAAPQPTLDQLLSDPAFKQQLMTNEQLRNDFVSQYMNNKQQTGQQVPPVLGNQPGGATPTIPEQSPKSIGEASKMFSRFLNGF